MNYVNIEITKMLPHNLHNDWTNAWWIPSKYYGQDAVEQFGEWMLSSRIDLVNENVEVYKAWTHEEVRLWLQRQSYEIEIGRYIKYEYYFKIRYNNDIVFDKVSYNTYEEARNEAIVECLKMIDDEMELQDRDKN